MNEREQLELESYLREFHLRAPKALPIGDESLKWRRIAAGIVLFFLCTASFWSGLSQQHPMPAASVVVTQPRTKPSSILLTKLALEKPTEFNARLNAQAEETLQRFDGPNSALRPLSKD